MRITYAPSAWLKVLLLSGGIAVLAGVASADTFVSFNGGFHFDYPLEWTQVDYNTAEYYLRSNNQNDSVEFEALFAEKASYVIFQGQYMILTVDTVGALNAEGVDSLTNSLSEEFDRPDKKVGADQFLAASLLDSIAFDTANGLLAIESEVPGGEAGERVNLLVMKMYDRGVANFYFYAPKVEFAASLPTFREMVMSFSTSEVPKTATEDVRVADLDDDDNDSGMPVAIYGGLAAVLIALIATRMRRRTKK